MQGFLEGKENYISWFGLSPELIYFDPKQILMALKRRPVVESWFLNHRTTLYLLENIPEDFFNARYYPETRTVGEQFAHIHAVRLMWISVQMPLLAKKLMNLPSKGEFTKDQLQKALKHSADHISAYLGDSEIKGRIKDWEGSVTSFMTYLVAHESHHRGLIMAALRVSGHDLEPEVTRTMWEWGKRN